MDGNVFVGGAVLAAVVAGMIALFAPCCVSVMLPAYFATAFQNRRLLVAMTFLYGAGVATVILPIGLGAHFLRQAIGAGHSAIYVGGGILLLGLAAYLMLGGGLHLPAPSRSTNGRTGPVAVYTLGVFSGVASSCCAPVLAGVITLSGLTSSFGTALLLGTAYVFGMVAPLFVLSLAWERYDWKRSALFRPRRFTYRIGRFERTISGTNVASALLLAAMGVLSFMNGAMYSSMPKLADWQAWITIKLQHYGKVGLEAVSWLPGWTAILLLGAVVWLLARRAMRQVGWVGEIQIEEPVGGEELERQDA